MISLTVPINYSFSIILFEMYINLNFRRIIKQFHSDMAKVITISDHIPIMTSSVRTTGCTHIDSFQEIRFPLGIISVKDIDVTTKADI